MRRSSLLLALMSLLPSAAFAWSGSPRDLAAVSAPPGLVRVCHDGDFGAFVAWRQEGSTSVHLMRVDAEGEPAPEWPAQGIELGSGATTLRAMGLVADAEGGAYLWWLSQSTLRLTRVTRAGAVAPGWTSAGRALGSTSSAWHRPWVESDGSGGLWVGLFTGMRDGFFTPSARLWHLGPDGAGVAGWPVNGRAVPLTAAADEWIHSASFAPASDGGAWALLATGRVDGTTILPGEWRMTRFTSSGALHPSMPAPGVVLGAFEADLIGARVPVAALGAISPDGEGGLLTLRAQLSGQPNSWFAMFRCDRRFEDGSLRPAQGPTSSVGWWYEPGPPDDHELGARLLLDSQGSRWVMAPAIVTDAPVLLEIHRLPDLAGATQYVDVASGPLALVRAADRGGLLAASFKASGPTHYWDPGPAFAGLRGTSGAAWSEETYSYLSTAYVSADVASLPDGGAILAWSRVFDPAGVRLLRLGADGSPLSVPLPSAGRALALRHVPGRGIVLTLGAAGAEEVRVWDTAGRSVARLGSLGPGEHIVPGSAGLAPGLYLARARVSGGDRERGRVIVTR